MEKNVTSFDGTRITYNLIEGKKDPLIFIHGAGGSYENWTWIAEKFRKEGHKIIMIDLRGHGYSSRPKKYKDYQIENHVKDIRKVLQKEKIKQPIMIGHCFGGAIITKYVENYPVKGLIYISSEPFAPRALKYTFKILKPISPIVFKILEYYHPKDRLEHYRPDTMVHLMDFHPIKIISSIRQTSFKSWSYTYSMYSGFEANYESIKCPVLILYSEGDNVCPARKIKKFKDIIEAEMKEIGGKHAMFVEDPDTTYNVIKEFLQSKRFKKEIKIPVR